MKVVILYHPQSEHARTVEDYSRDFTHQMGHNLELISLESIDGARMATTYDIVRYPAILVLNENGELMKSWQGPVMPLMNEVAFYYQ